MNLILPGHIRHVVTTAARHDLSVSVRLHEHHPSDAEHCVYELQFTSRTADGHPVHLWTGDPQFPDPSVNRQDGGDGGMEYDTFAEATDAWLVELGVHL